MFAKDTPFHVPVGFSFGSSHTHIRHLLLNENSHINFSRHILQIFHHHVSKTEKALGVRFDFRLDRLVKVAIKHHNFAKIVEDKGSFQKGFRNIRY